MLLLGLLVGCLIDKDAYERRKDELTDSDGDGFAQEDDCDDADPAVSPDADELCNGYDDNCDGVADEDAADAHLIGIIGQRGSVLLRNLCGHAFQVCARLWCRWHLARFSCDGGKRAHTKGVFERVG